MINGIFRQIVVSVLILLLVLPSVLSAYEETTLKDKPILDEILFSLKVRTYMKIINMPSLVACVIYNNSVVWSKTYGCSGVYIRHKANLDSIYVVGSISKTIVATALMQLYENENFGLDDNISKFLPFDIKNPNHPAVNITFRMLLAHQSSLGDTFFDLFHFLPLIDNRSQWIEERLIPGQEKYRETYWKDYAPGENCSYSNMGFVLLALLVEKISGMPFEEYCQKNIFSSLCMNSTSFNIEGLNKRKLARPNFHVFGGIYIPFFNYDAKCLAACGGLRTTADDLSHFLIVHMNKGVWNGVRILNESTIELMHSVQYPNSTQSFYDNNLQHGLGWIHLNLSGEMWQGYNGGAIGYCCNMMFKESSNIGVIMLSNGHFSRSFFSKERIVYYNKLGDLLIQKAEVE